MTYRYVAMFPETTNAGQAAASSIDVGYMPQVTGILTAFDGGKIIVGYGRVGGGIYKSWAIKIFGNQGTSTSKCSTTATLSGYVKVIPGMYTELTATANCVKTSDA